MNALTPFDTDWKTPTPFSWKRAFARAFPKMAGWPASIWNDAVVRAADSLDDGRDYQFDLLR